jgi:L-aminopeptidase/D-esterase-like protein
MIDRYPDHFRNGIAWAMPVVAETYDGILNDINAMFVQPEHAVHALNSATSGPVAEGAVGGGTGMIAYEFKAGTGTASRKVTVAGQEYTVGVLVQANHGKRPWFNVLGQPVGRLMPFEGLVPKETGSIIVVIATDAPLSTISLTHLARRAGLGLGRGGTPGGNSSGDIFLAFSTAPFGAMPQSAGALIPQVELNAELIDPVYLAAVEAVEESVVNAIVAGTDTPTFKFPGKTIPGIDRDALAALF